MNPPIIADTGGLLKALAVGRDGQPTWPEFADALVRATSVIVPALVLAEVDYFLRNERAAMRRLLAEVLDPRTTYELEPATPRILGRGMEIDHKFSDLGLGLVDATVAATAEHRRVYHILTSDHGDFGPLRVGATFRQALTLIP